jgi:hypothetical protein
VARMRKASRAVEKPRLSRPNFGIEFIYTEHPVPHQVAWFKWEFLRRNREYRADHKQFIDTFGSWFRQRGFWYDHDRREEQWTKADEDHFYDIIAPAIALLCEKWKIGNLYPPKWKFDRKDGTRKIGSREISPPTGIAAELNWDFDVMRELVEMGFTGTADSARRYRSLVLIEFDLNRPMMKGEEQVLRERLNCHGAADVVSDFRNKLVSADTFDAIRIVEANAAACYFREWRWIPVTWPKADLPKIPDHWRFAGSRQSPLTGGPRLAVTPVHAVLNYCFALLQAETRLAVSILGLDAGLGVGLHTDTANRDSLALDVLEPIRPQIEAWLLNWIASEPFRRSDFFETGTGNCRLMSHLCTRLSGTTSVWKKLVAPWAEYVARTLSTTKSGRERNSTPPTRLTQRHRTEAKGKVWTANIKFPKAHHVCRGCGKTIENRSDSCAQCSIGSSTERLINAAQAGRMAGHSPEALAKEGKTQRRHALARSSWSPDQQPAWLTEKFYSEKIRPFLALIPASAIARQISVSRWYAGRLREGYRPHPRHWQALAKMVGISAKA